MSKNINETAATINALVNAGYSLEEAAAIAKLINPTTTAKPSIAKTAKTAKQSKTTAAKTTAKPSTAKTAKTAKPKKADLDREAAATLDGHALFMATAFAIEESEDSRDGSKIWLVRLDESQARLSKPEWLAVTNWLGKVADVSYWRGNWQFRFNPLHFVQSGELTAEEAKAVATRKAERKAAKAAKKSA